MAEIKYFSAEGLEKLREELNELKTKGRADMARQIAEAREKGDLSENAEYDAAKEAQGMLEMKIAILENDLSIARVLDESKVDGSKIIILSNVRLYHKGMQKELYYTLVSQNEADLKTGKLSIESPIGKGLLGKSLGDIVTITTPSGPMELEVLEISRG